MDERTYTIVNTRRMQHRSNNEYIEESDLNIDVIPTTCSVLHMSPKRDVYHVKLMCPALSNNNAITTTTTP